MLSRRIARLMLTVAVLLAPGAQAIVRVAVISDLNGSYGSAGYEAAVSRSIARLVELRPDLIISTGDMVAGQRLHPLLSRPVIEAMWQGFHAAVTDPIRRARIPFAVTPGNHDASSGRRFALEREIYREQWGPRRPPLDFIDAAAYPFRYAFRVGDVLFASLDATHVGHLSRAEKQWLRSLLQGPGKRFRHRVVFSHIPVWPFSVGRENEILGDAELEAILREGRVDLHLSGHHHAYYPGFKDGVRYVSQGCLGAAPRPLLGAAGHSERSITVIDFEESGTVRVEAYGGAGYRQPIARSELPPRIESRWATLVRDDLASTTPKPGDRSQAVSEPAR